MSKESPTYHPTLMIFPCCHTSICKSSIKMKMLQGQAKLHQYLFVQPNEKKVLLEWFCKNKKNLFSTFALLPAATPDRAGGYSVCKTHKQAAAIFPENPSCRVLHHLHPDNLHPAVTAGGQKTLKETISALGSHCLLVCEPLRSLSGFT